MTTQAQSTSQHLAVTQRLLGELDADGQRAHTDPRAKAVTAAAQAILVLAEQVAAIRVLMVEDALSRRGNGQPTPQRDEEPKKRGW